MLLANPQQLYETKEDELIIYLSEGLQLHHVFSLENGTYFYILGPIIK